MRCDRCGKFRSGPWTMLPITQADYLFGDADPRYICEECVGMSAPRSMVAAGKPSRAALPLSTDNERTAAPMDDENDGIDDAVPAVDAPAPRPAVPGQAATLGEQLAADARAASRAEYAMYYRDNPSELGENNPLL